MAVTISDEGLASAHLSEVELKCELAIALFQQERVTLAQASRLAEMTQLSFQVLIADRRIPIHYGVQFREDLQIAARIRRRLIVVSDTSPVLSLARIGRLDLL